MLHLHTQFNRDIPWSEIDMDFMNLNQSAHGDREFGFMMSTDAHQPKSSGWPLGGYGSAYRLVTGCVQLRGWNDWQGMPVCPFWR